MVLVLLGNVVISVVAEEGGNDEVKFPGLVATDVDGGVDKPVVTETCGDIRPVGTDALVTPADVDCPLGATATGMGCNVDKALAEVDNDVVATMTGDG